MFTLEIIFSKNFFNKQENTFFLKKIIIKKNFFLLFLLDIAISVYTKSRLGYLNTV